MHLFFEAPGHLSYRVSHILDVANCVTLCYITCSSIFCFSCKLVVRYRGLIRFKFTFKTEVYFMYSEIYRSQVYCLLSFDNCICSCNPHPHQNIKYVHHPTKVLLLLSFDHLFLVSIEMKLNRANVAKDFNYLC